MWNIGHLFTITFCATVIKINNLFMALSHYGYKWHFLCVWRSARLLRYVIILFCGLPDDTLTNLYNFVHISKSFILNYFYTGSGEMHGCGGGLWGLLIMNICLQVPALRRSYIRCVMHRRDDRDVVLYKFWYNYKIAMSARSRSSRRFDVVT